MKDNHIQHQVSELSSQSASWSVVLLEAARRTINVSFGYGVASGVIGFIVLMVVLSLLTTNEGAESNSKESNETLIGEPRERDSGPFFGVRQLGPQVPGKYAYSISRDSFLPVVHADGAAYPSGTIKDGQFMLTEHRPSEALSLPQDIDDTWRSPSIFSAKLKDATALQRSDASWWSESRGEYIPWESRDVNFDRYVFDAVHHISVPILMLDQFECAVASRAPLRLIEDRLCLFSASMKGFVPLHCPENVEALWDEHQSCYVTTSDIAYVATSIYPAVYETPNSEETKE